MPEEWAWCRLKEVCELKGGKRIPAGLSATKEKTNHIYIRVADMQNNSISDADLVYITDDIFEKIQRYTINKDDLYLTIAGTIGRVGEVPEIFDGMNLTENALKLTNISICKKYLMQILNTKLVQDYFESTYHQVAMPKLSLINASKTIIPVPPLDEQQKIVNEIDNIFSITNKLDIDIVDLEYLITQTKSKILDLAIHGKLVPQDPNDEPAEELLKRIATSDNRPYKKFDDDIPFSLPQNWEWCYLGDICKISSAKRVLQQDWKDSGIPFYRAREIAQLSNNEKVKDDLFITPELYSELKNKYGVPISGDLMISAVGTIGKVYIVKETDCFYYKDASVICFSKKEKSIDSKYLKLCLESGFLQNQIYSQSTGTTVDTITINKAQEYLFPLPNITEQQRIVSKIEEFFLYLDTISSNLE